MPAPKLNELPDGLLVRARLAALSAECDYFLDHPSRLSPDQRSLLNAYSQACRNCIDAVDSEPTVNMTDEETIAYCNTLSDEGKAARNAVLNFSRIFLTMANPSSFLVLPSHSAATANSVMGQLLHFQRSLTTESPIVLDTISFLVAILGNPLSIAESTITIDGEEHTASILLAHISPSSSATGGTPIAILGNPEIAEALSLEVNPASPSDDDGPPTFPFSISTLSPGDLAVISATLLKECRSKTALSNSATVIRIDSQP